MLEVLEHTLGPFTPTQAHAVKMRIITAPGFPIPADDVVGMREYGDMLRAQLPANWHCYDADEVTQFPSAALASHDEVGERYAILDTPLQRGWQVHLCISDKGQLYAAKELGSDEFRSAKEHHIMNRLNHPNVCRVFGSVAKRHGGGGWLIIELGGKTLRQILQLDEARWTHVSTRLSVLRSILAGLTYLHTLAGQATRAVAHRDIKTDNIVMKLFAEEEKSASPQVLLIDFGSARQARTNNQFSFTSPRGTDGYRAPELSLRAAYTSQVDVFSTGVVAYEVLHTCHPFGGVTDTYEAIQTTIDRTSDYATLPAWSDLSHYPAITRLVLRMMSRDPSKRPKARWCVFHPCLWPSELMLALVRLWRDPLRHAPSTFNSYFLRQTAVSRKSNPWCWRDRHTEVLSALRSPDYNSPSGLIIALRDYYHHSLQTDLKQRAQALGLRVIDSMEELVLLINETFPRIDFMSTLVRAIHECWVNVDGRQVGGQVYNAMCQSRELHVLAVRCRDLLRSWYPGYRSRFADLSH
jgi:serine/threonine protein kinase